MSTQVHRAHELVDTDRMGSGFGGERQGQEIVDTAISAGTQSATSREPTNKAACEVIPICNRSGATSNAKNRSKGFRLCPVWRSLPSLCTSGCFAWISQLRGRKVVSPKGTSHGSIAHCKLTPKEESVKLWRRVYRYIATKLVFSRKTSRDLFTRSAVQQLPVSRELLREHRQNGQKEITASQNVLVNEGICPSCGGKTKIRVLNYWCEPWTDVISPADTREHCLACDWSGPVMEREQPM